MKAEEEINALLNSDIKEEKKKKLTFVPGTFGERHKCANCPVADYLCAKGVARGVKIGLTIGALMCTIEALIMFFMMR